jgi:FkbM family methyltransferase
MKTSLVNRMILFYSTALPDHRGKWRLVEFLRHRVATPLDGEQTVARAGVRWQLDPTDFMQSSLIWQPEVDRWELFHLRRFLKPGMVVFDVGSNFGYYSLLLAADPRTYCTVYAFEPNPPTYQRLLTNRALNGLEGRVLVHNLGLSDTVGSARMRERPHHLGGASIDIEGDGSAVALTTLDRFCEDQGITRLDFLKIDVEGYEDRVLRGARRTLERFQPGLLIELCPITLEQQNTSLEVVLNLLAESRYRLFEIHHRRLRPLTHLPRGEDYTNVFGFEAGRLGHGEFPLS